MLNRRDVRSGRFSPRFQRKASKWTSEISVNKGKSLNPRKLACQECGLGHELRHTEEQTWAATGKTIFSHHALHAKYGAKSFNVCPTEFWLNSFLSDFQSLSFWKGNISHMPMYLEIMQLFRFLQKLTVKNSALSLKRGLILTSEKPWKSWGIGEGATIASPIAWRRVELC